MTFVVTAKLIFEDEKDAQRAEKAIKNTDYTGCQHANVHTAPAKPHMWS